ncbi:hypothetical protein [Butyrivibrio sp. FCS014]|nr:hypothetical protein [Butyrivibrio sp. FCS014]
MGKIIEIFDDTRKKYVEMFLVNPSTMSEEDYKRIETELIRFADELAIAN